MREIVLAFVAMGIIMVGANFLLSDMGFSSQERTSGDAVRLD